MKYLNKNENFKQEKRRMLVSDEAGIVGARFLCNRFQIGRYERTTRAYGQNIRPRQSRFKRQGGGAGKSHCVWQNKPYVLVIRLRSVEGRGAKRLECNRDTAGDVKLTCLESSRRTQFLVLYIRFTRSTPVKMRTLSG